MAAAALLAAGPAALAVLPLGTALLWVALALAAWATFRAWRSSPPYRGRLVGTTCLVLSLGVTAMLLWGPVTVPSERHTLTLDGRRRAYRLYRPARVAPDRPVPVVIALHGLMQRAHTMERLTGLDRLAEREGFLAVYPEGYRRSWNDTDRTKPATRAGIDDLRFLRALIDELAERDGADRSRIYVVGFSNGGFLALRAACELSRQIAGVAVVGAGVTAAFPPDEDPDRAVSTMFVLGRDDPLVPWGVFGASAERWSRRLDCANGDTRSWALPDRERDGTRGRAVRYAGCPDGAAVLQLTIEGGGHTWPGGPQYLPRLLVGRTSRDFDATAEIWDFWERAPGGSDGSRANDEGG